MKAAVAFVASLFAIARAGTVLWSGDFDYYTTTTDFDNWSWANQVGEYQYYIHGSGPVTQYLDVSTAYAHPGISSESKGLKLSIDQTSTWNSNFWRTELIPQTNNNLGTGQKYYHFSVKRSSTNPPLFSYEHQVAFFESHFTELKVGISPYQSYLLWCVSGTPKYAVPFTPDVWYNFAFDIDFTGSTVGLWVSTGNAPLLRVFAQIPATTYSNSADWHLGVLAFDQGTATEDWYFAGVYVETDTLTTDLRSGGLASTNHTTTTTTSMSSPSTTATTTASGVAQTHWGFCAGKGYGPLIPLGCVSPYVCFYENDWFSQCI
ncbi:hypothetical protein FS837_009817 [Tulasnella sp. UAMH 9824]|nr:hypothetical protein FS837_009817 [Tulasnella sp. UAMH 9824]